MDNRSGLLGAIILGVILVVGTILVFMCVERVPAGYVGVVYNMNGGIEDETLSQGWHIVAPTKKVTLYSVGLEQSYLTSESKGDSDKDESFSIPTSDGKTVKVDLEFSYRFDESRVAETFVTFKGKSGETIKDTFIKPKIVAWTQEVSANYPVTDIFGDKRTQINAELDTYLKQKFDQYGIIIDTVNFTNISVDEETAAAIQKKVTAQQELELAQIEANTARVNAEKEKEVANIQAEKEKDVATVNAETQRITAEGNATKKKIDAQAEADAIEIKAKAEANANKLIGQSITENYLNYQHTEKWDGKYPSVISGETSTNILNIPEKAIE